MLTGGKKICGKENLKYCFSFSTFSSNRRLSGVNCQAIVDRQASDYHRWQCLSLIDVELFFFKFYFHLRRSSNLTVESTTKKFQKKKLGKKIKFIVDSMVNNEQDAKPDRRPFSLKHIDENKILKHIISVEWINKTPTRNFPTIDL